GYRHFSAQAKAIFHQRTRVWTTHGVGKSESMDARAFPVPNPRISAARKPVRRFGRFTSSWRDVPSPDAGRIVGSNLRLGHLQGGSSANALQERVCTSLCLPNNPISPPGGGPESNLMTVSSSEVVHY